MGPWSPARWAAVAACAWGLALGASAAPPARPTPTAEQLARLGAGDVVLETVREAGTSAAVRGLVEIDATHAQVWEVLLDYEVLRTTAKSVKEVEILQDRWVDPTQRVIGLRFLLQVGPFDVTYHVLRDYRPAERTMTWVLDKSRENDITWSEGWFATHDGYHPGRVAFAYLNRVDTGTWAPRWLEDDLTRSSVERYMARVKLEAERR